MAKSVYEVYFTDNSGDPMRIETANKREAEKAGRLYIKQWGLDATIAKVEKADESTAQLFRARQLAKEWPQAVSEMNDFGDYVAIDELKKRIEALPDGLLEQDKTTGNLVVVKDIQKQTDGKEEIMAEETTQDRNGVFITIPTKIAANRESVHKYEFTDKETGELHQRASITLPKGTVVNGQDVSGYKFSCSQGQLDPGGQKYESTHSVLLSEINNEGKPWSVTLTLGHNGTDGKWVVDDTVKCTSKELQTSMQEQYERYKNYRKEHQAEKDTTDKAPSLSDEAKDMRAASAELGSKEASAPEPQRDM